MCQFKTKSVLSRTASKRFSLQKFAIDTAYLLEESPAKFNYLKHNRYNRPYFYIAQTSPVVLAMSAEWKIIVYLQIPSTANSEAPRQHGRPNLRYKEVIKQDLPAFSILLTFWEVDCRIEN